MTPLNILNRKCHYLLTLMPCQMTFFLWNTTEIFRKSNPPLWVHVMWVHRSLKVDSWKTAQCKKWFIQPQLMNPCLLKRNNTCVCNTNTNILNFLKCKLSFQTNYWMCTQTAHCEVWHKHVLKLTWEVMQQHEGLSFLMGLTACFWHASQHANVLNY